MKSKVRDAAATANGKGMDFMGRTRSQGIGGYSAFINRSSTDDTSGMRGLDMRKAMGESGFSPKQLAARRERQKLRRRVGTYGNKKSKGSGF